MLLQVYGYIRSLADTRYGPALAHGRDVLSIEKHLGLDVELRTNHWLTRHHDLSEVAVWIYQHMHTGFTMGILLLCYLAGPGVYRPARNALVLTNLAGLVVFFVLPVMPPRLLPDEGFVDSVAMAGFGTVHSPGGVEADQFAAMPSLHMGWAVWVAVVIMALLPRYRVRWLAVLHPVVTAIVVVITANHYVLDVIAGVAVSMAALFGTGLVWAGNGTTYAAGQLIKRNRPAPVPDPADLVDAEPGEADGKSLVPAEQAAGGVGGPNPGGAATTATVSLERPPGGITRADPDKGPELASP
ncbi:phosphatase PAP2 family protein [Actinomadura montaniterrae]|uniref:phosphatase PAP2 family protein n=1 Tax=Actinomadura montaniterrae TaxID=1803903 RepID=UPI00178C56B9|nr:phosphatase PAP2 family protein [Actinomadura montaniterrae]